MGPVLDRRSSHSVIALLNALSSEVLVGLRCIYHQLLLILRWASAAHFRFETLCFFLYISVLIGFWPDLFILYKINYSQSIILIIVKLKKVRNNDDAQTQVSRIKAAEKSRLLAMEEGCEFKRNLCVEALPCARPRRLRQIQQASGQSY